MVSIAVLPQEASLILQSGKRTISLKSADLEHYRGERGRRGNKLPRGFQRVDGMTVEEVKESKETTKEIVDTE